MHKYMKKAGATLAGLLLSASVHAVPIAVDLELILATDVSGSVDGTDFALRRSGVEAAFRDADVIDAITSGAIGSIVVTLWDFATSVNVAVDWFEITDAASSNAFADAVIAAPRASVGNSDGQSNMINEAASAIAQNDYDATRSVIDIASEGAQDIDGCSFDSVYCQSTIDAGAAFLAAGGTAINAIWMNDRNFFGLDDNDLINAFEYGNTSVLAGDGSFQLFAETNADFTTAIRTKILREIKPPIDVPLPGTLLLMGLGLLGLRYGRR